MRIAGAAITSLQLSHPARGSWSATAQIDADTAPSGRVALELPGLTLQGDVVDAGIWSETCRVTLCGLLALVTEVPGQHYLTPTGGLVAQQLCAAAGAELDPASDPAAVQQLLSAYQVRRGTLGAALDALCAALATDWTVTPEARVRLGLPTWPEAAPEGAVLLEEVAARRELRLALENAALLPGVTYQGRRIVAVDHLVQPAGWRAVARY